MKLRSVSAYGFRGLRSSNFDLDLEKAFILYGLNGTGKSSLFRAFQFCLTGKLPSVPESDLPVEEVYRHASLTDTESAQVECEIVDEAGGHSIQRELESDGEQNVSTSTAAAEELIHDDGTKHCFLTRREFAKMVEAAERDRWNRLSPLLGHQKLAEYRDGLRRISLRLREDLEIRQLEEESEELGSELERLEERYERRLEELELSDFNVAVLRSEVEELIGEDDPDVLQELERLQHVEDIETIDWEVLKNALGGSDRLAEFTERLSLLDQQLDVLTFELSDPTEIEDVLDLLRRFATEPDVAHEVLHEEFFGQARTVVDSYSDESCPVCDLTPDDWDSVRDSLDRKRERLEEIAREKREVHDTVRSDRTTVRGVVQDIQNYSDEHDDLERLAPVNDELCTLRDFLQLTHNRLESRPPEGLTDEERRALGEALVSVREARDEARSAAQEERETVAEQIERLGEAPDRVRLSNLEAMAEVFADVRSKSDRLAEISTRLEVLDQLIDQVQEYSTEVEEAEGQLSTELLELVEDRVGEIFRQMTDNPSFEPVINRFEERRVVKAEIMISDFHGLGQRPVREFLSESNRHALGLAIYFAAMEYRSPRLDALVMDDITHSTDARHRRGLAQFLYEDLSESYQLILMTHDREWYNLLRNLFERSGARYEKLLRWEITGVKTRGDDWQSLREQAHTQILNQEDRAGTTLRMALEEFIQELGVRFNVQVPLRRHPDEIGFETKRNALISRIRKLHEAGQGIIDPTSAAVRAFQNSQDLANLASHYPTEQQLSGQALRDALSDFEDFADLFICTNTVDGHECGWTLRSLRNTDPGRLACPQCQRPYGL